MRWWVVVGGRWEVWEEAFDVVGIVGGRDWNWDSAADW